MAIFDSFKENFELLLYLAYKRNFDYPIVIRSTGNRSTGGVYCRNGDALDKLRQIEKELRRLNRSIEEFFGVDPYCLPTNGEKRRRGRPRKSQGEIKKTR